MSLLLEFVSTQTWAQARAVVERHEAQLLTHAADAAIDLMISTVRDRDAGAAANLEQHRRVLRRCREIGIREAFEEVAGGAGSGHADQGADTSDEVRLGMLLFKFVAAPTWDQSRRLLDEHPELLSVAVDAVLERLITGAGGIIEQMMPAADSGRVESEVESLERHGRLLRRCREIGVDAAFAEVQASHLQEQELEEDLRPVLFEFVTAGSRRQARRIVEAHPELLSAQALDFLERIVEGARAEGDNDRADWAQSRLTLLRRCVESGMADAFAEDRDANRGQEAVELLFELMARPLLEWPQMVREQPELLGDDAERALENLTAQARTEGEHEVVTKLEQLETFLRQSRERWTPPPRGDKPAGQDPEWSVMSQFLQAGSWATSQRIVEEYPELLTEAADRLVSQLMAAAELREDGAAAAETLEVQRQLLRRCRKVGITEAFEEVRLHVEGPSADQIETFGLPSLRDWTSQERRRRSCWRSARRRR
ncbi:MAG: hypothetical protein ACRDYX_06065 [Egibacteraceae bacterium]